MICRTCPKTLNHACLVDQCQACRAREGRARVVDKHAEVVVRTDAAVELARQLYESDPRMTFKHAAMQAANRYGMGWKLVAEFLSAVCVKRKPQAQTNVKAGAVEDAKWFFEVAGEDFRKSCRLAAAFHKTPAANVQWALRKFYGYPRGWPEMKKEEKTCAQPFWSRVDSRGDRTAHGR
jgi:hypothetical protein